MLAASVLPAGCASTPKLLQLDPASEVERKRIVWPQPPERPRFAWAGELVGEANFKESKDEAGTNNLLRWLVGIVVGELQQPMRVQRPQAGAIDETGRIFVSDAANSAVFVFDPEAGEIQVWDRAEGYVNFVNPIGVAVGPRGEVLVTDAQLGIVARLDAKGNARRAIGRGVLRRPTGVAYDPQGRRIYVADTAAHDIKVFDEDGRHLRTVGRRGEGPGEFNFPTHLVFARGELYVTDTMNSRIQILREEGTIPSAQVGSRGMNIGNLVRPKGVAVDREGHIYVVESYHDHLLVFNRAGDLLLAIGGGGHAPGRFDLPAGVWTDNANRVFVADMMNARVAIFQYLGSGP